VFTYGPQQRDYNRWHGRISLGLNLDVRQMQGHLGLAADTLIKSIKIVSVTEQVSEQFPVSYLNDLFPWEAASTRLRRMSPNKNRHIISIGCRPSMDIRPRFLQFISREGTSCEQLQIFGWCVPVVGERYQKIESRWLTGGATGNEQAAHGNRHKGALAYNIIVPRQFITLPDQAGLPGTNASPTGCGQRGETGYHYSNQFYSAVCLLLGAAGIIWGLRHVILIRKYFIKYTIIFFVCWVMFAFGTFFGLVSFTKNADVSSISGASIAD
jgi:hypothetical protein